MYSVQVRWTWTGEVAQGENGGKDADGDLTINTR